MKPLQIFAALFLFLSITNAAAQSFTPLTSDHLVFVNVDHAPMGAESTFAYGAKGDQCGIETTGARVLDKGHGVLIALKSSTGLQVMPFLNLPRLQAPMQLTSPMPKSNASSAQERTSGR